MDAPGHGLTNHEFATLWEHFDRVVDAITDPDAVAEETCKVGLIHPESKKILQSLPVDTKTKARSLLQSIEGKIEGQPVLFHHFLALLKNLPGLADLGIVLQKTYDDKVTACVGGEPGVPSESAGFIGGPIVHDANSRSVSKDEHSAMTTQQEDNGRSGESSNKVNMECSTDHVKAIDDVPELHQLEYLEHGSLIMKTIDRVAAKWKRVALRLHFEDHCIEVIEMNHHYQLVPACRSMFSQWLQGQGREPRTWRTLIVALEEANLHTIAQELRNIFPVQFSGTGSDHTVQTNSSPTGQTPLSEHNHSVLLEQLQIHSAKWREIGSYLGFRPSELDEIQARLLLLNGAPTSWLSAVLADWLQWAPGDSRGSTSFATLEDLKAALNQAGLGAATYNQGIEGQQTPRPAVSEEISGARIATSIQLDQSQTKYLKIESTQSEIDLSLFDNLSVEKCCKHANLSQITCGVNLDGVLFLCTTIKLFKYSPSHVWSNEISLLLPQEGLSEFSIAIHNNQLYLIGGRLNGKMTNKVFTCVFGSEYYATKWYEFPSLVNNRCSVSTTSDDNTLLVAGGWGDNNTPHLSMEIYVKDNKSWKLVDLPVLYKPGNLDLLIINQHLYCSGLTDLLVFDTNEPARPFYSAPLKTVAGKKPQWKLIKSQPPSHIMKFCEQIVSVTNQVVQVYLPRTESWKTVLNFEMQESISLIVSVSSKTMVLIAQESMYMMTVIDPVKFKHIKATLQAMEKKGILNHSVVHGVFIGPARSGKNSIMERLLGRMPSSNIPSTGVAEAVIQVQVGKPVPATVAANVEGSIWSRMDSNDEAIRLMFIHNDPTYVQYKRHKKRASTESSPIQSRSDKHSKVLTQDFAPTSSKTMPLDSQPSIQSAKNMLSQIILTNPVHELPDSFVQPFEILKEAIQHKGLQALQQHFQTTWSLYLTNTGGQMEFQDILPLLVSGPCMFFYCFRLDRELSTHYAIEYYSSDGENTTSYTSSLTTIEGILQSLASIAAMGIFVYRGKSERQIQLQPKVFFIGTHSDMLPSDSAAHTIAKVDQHLQECTKQFHSIIEFASESTMIFTVNNFSEDEIDFINVRIAVQRVVDRQEFEMVSPSNWLIFSLVLRKLEPEIISYEECLNVANQCNILDVSELNEALHFIHTKMGLIRYYMFDNLKDIVVIKPHFLYEKISDLIVKTFTFEKAGKLSTDKFKQRGIFSFEDFERIERKGGSNGMEPSQFTKLLEKLRIVAPFKIEDKIFYFIPCVLTHARESNKRLEIISSSVPPIVVNFDHGYCPKGLGGALINYLLTNEMNSDCKWNLLTDCIFRDQVSFRVGPLDTVIFKITSTHLIIYFIPNSGHIDRKGCTIEQICMRIRAAIESGIPTILDGINHIGVNFKLTFLCPCSQCCNNSPADIETYDDQPYLTCSKSKEQSSLPLGYEKWCTSAASVLQEQIISQDPHQTIVDVIANVPKDNQWKLNEEIDFENKGSDGQSVPKHLGIIAKSMLDWELAIADHMDLTEPERRNITEGRNKDRPDLQRREVLTLWKTKLGDKATYRALIKIFVRADRLDYAENICHLFHESTDVSAVIKHPRVEAKDEADDLLPVAKRLKTEGDGEPGISAEKLLIGVDVCGETFITLSNSESAKEWEWKGYGLKLKFPERGILSTDTEQCVVHIKVSLSGHYQLPEDSHLVSATFWFYCDPPCRFRKPIIIEIQHCATSDSMSNLSFVKSTKEAHLHVFKPVKGNFSMHSSFGILEVNQFCGIGITMNGSDVRKYLSSLLYKLERGDSVRVDFYLVMTWNLDIHHTLMMEHFKLTKFEADQPLLFEADSIEFDVSTGSKRWKVTPVNSHVVKKIDIDDYAPGRTSWIPHSYFKAKLLMGESTSNIDTSDFECNISMIGAKEPYNKFNIDISPLQAGVTETLRSGPDAGTTSESLHTELVKPTLKLLMRELKVKAADWEDIGVELEVDDGILKQIKLDNPADSKSCLRELFRKWLSCVDPQPSWASIVEAIGGIGDEELASRLKSKY